MDCQLACDWAISGGHRAGQVRIISREQGFVKVFALRDKLCYDGRLILIVLEGRRDSFYG
jgi:hypothetical protein